MQPVYVSEAQAACHMVMGTHTRLLLTGEQTNQQFSLYRVTAPQGGMVPLHVHDREDETFIIREGHVRIVVEDTVILAAPGDIVFGLRGIPHSWEAVAPGASVLEIMTTPAARQTMFRELGALEPGASTEKVIEVCACSAIRFLPVPA